MNKVQNIHEMLSKVVPPICRVISYRCSISAENLHIIKGGDKLQELSRVPTCHTNIKCNLNVLFIPFKIGRAHV